jgi:cytochrome P450
MIFRLHYGAVLIIECQQTFVQVLYRLLANPDYIEPLRQEVEAVIREEGWTKAGIDKMFKIDSIIRETQRIDGLSFRSLDSFPKYEMLIRSLLLSRPVALSRIALRPFTFSNGVTVPAGTFVAVPGTAVQTDERTHPNRDEFDGFRFAKLCEALREGAEYNGEQKSNSLCVQRTFTFWTGATHMVGSPACSL